MMLSDKFMEKAGLIFLIVGCFGVSYLIALLTGNDWIATAKQDQLFILAGFTFYALSKKQNKDGE